MATEILNPFSKCHTKFVGALALVMQVNLHLVSALPSQPFECSNDLWIVLLNRVEKSVFGQTAIRVELSVLDAGKFFLPYRHPFGGSSLVGIVKRLKVITDGHHQALIMNSSSCAAPSNPLAADDPAEKSDKEGSIHGDKMGGDSNDSSGDSPDPNLG